MGKKQSKDTEEQMIEEEYQEYCKNCKPNKPMSFHDWEKQNGYN